MCAVKCTTDRYPRFFFPQHAVKHKHRNTQKFNCITAIKTNWGVRMSSAAFRCKCSPLIQRSARRLLCTVNICCNEYKVRSLSLWPSRSSRLKWVSCFHIFIYKDVKDAFFQVFIPLTQHDVAPLRSSLEWAISAYGISALLATACISQLSKANCQAWMFTKHNKLKMPQISVEIR